VVLVTAGLPSQFHQVITTFVQCLTAGKSLAGARVVQDVLETEDLLQHPRHHSHRHSAMSAVQHPFQLVPTMAALSLILAKFPVGGMVQMAVLATGKPPTKQTPG
jgi:hypothetical protein